MPFRSRPFRRTLHALATAAALATTSAAWPAITSTGDVSPANPSTWTGSMAGYIGNTSVGSLIVNTGSMLVSNNGFLGYGYGSMGTVTVDGTGSTWTANNELLIGYAGVGILNISNGGNVIASGDPCYFGYQMGASGTVNVNGLGSSWTSGALHIGYAGTGTLNITDGSNANCSSTTYIGENANTTGIVTVDGAGSSWTNGGTLYVGYFGSGTLNLTNGAQVTTMGTTYVASGNVATGMINFGLNGGTLTAQSLYVAPSQLAGTGKVNTCGLVSDGNLTLDAAHGLTQTLSWNNVYQNVTVNLDLTGGSGPVGDLGAGYLGSGTLTIQNGIQVTSSNGYLGYKAGSLGVATVDGIGSAWANTGAFYVGYSGRGTLNITNGGQVMVATTTFTACNSLISFGLNGGTLTTQSLCAASAQLTGTGTINTRGLVSDIELVFDATHGLTRTLSFNGANQNVTVNLDLTGNSGSVGALGAGSQGSGTLTIQDGVNVPSAGGYLGYNPGSTGIATVSGTGSTWTSSGTIYVGYAGTGTLCVTNGGNISTASGVVGCQTGSTGTVTVDGTASTWIFTGSLSVGYSGNGTLNITNGGQVISKNAGNNIGSQTGSTGIVNVNGSSSIWTNFNPAVGGLGDGILNITNGGKVNSSLGGFIGQLSMGTAAVDGAGSTWNCSGSFYVGLYANAALYISNGGKVNCSGNFGPYIANSAGTSGTVTVSGAGATWACNGAVAVGYSGSGVLNITNGGKVSSSLGYGNNAASILGSNTGSMGTATVDGAGSMWTSSTNFSVGGYGNGWLNVTNGGHIGNWNGYVGGAFGQTGTGTVSVAGANSTWTNSGALYVGNSGSGTVSVTGGGNISDGTGYVGSSSSGSTGSGMITVSGVGSSWTNSSALYVGNFGNGSLGITNGGSVTDTIAYIGDAFNKGVGTVTVSGVGATWSNSGALNVGNTIPNLGAGFLYITNGGKVAANGVSIGNNSLLAMCIGDGSSLNTGTGNLANGGTLRLKAASGSSAGTYTPVSALSWSGSGTVQALGGTWSTSTHKFTVTDPSNATTGQATTINLFQTQRIAITDPTSGDIVDAAFPATTATSSLTFTASLLTDPQTALLTTTLPANTTELAAWTFTTTGYTTGTPVFLSFDIGSGYSSSTLALYHFDGSAWTPYAAPDLSYDGTYANFTVTGFSGYAVVAPTPAPEPATLAVLGLGVAGMLVRRRGGRGRGWRCRSD